MTFYIIHTYFVVSYEMLLCHHESRFITYSEHIKFSMEITDCKEGIIYIPLQLHYTIIS